MQNRYAADIGDFGKYALLNSLAGRDLRLGVNWYLNPAEETSADGQFTAYPALRDCDEELFEKLQRIVRSGLRSVGAVEQSRVLPPDTLFYSQPIPVCGQARREKREQWWRAGLEATRGAHLVFLDPDNGFAGESVSASSRACAKYVLLEEIEELVRRGQSVVVYHHQTRRKGGLAVEIPMWLGRLRRFAAAEPFALVFRRRSVRVYFVIPSAVHEVILRKRAEGFVNGVWGKAFELPRLRLACASSAH